MLSSRYLKRWYGTGIFLMIFMVAVGGITRLTDSGLSMVDWQPIYGILPPLSDSDWENEFNQYKEYPEYRYKNINLTLSEFKYIYYWEYIHRMLGRIIGLFFIFPLVYFSIKKSLDKIEFKKILTIIVLIAFQGILGWYMVKSGLRDNPNISHFRLMFHYMMAMILISFTYLQYLRHSYLKEYRISISLNTSWLIFSLIIIQIIFGTFMAGLNAGHYYNTFPLMDGSILPLNILYNHSMGIIENLFYNQATVQYIHRLLGFILLIISLKIIFDQFKEYNLTSLDTKLAILLLAQFILGVITLVTGVNIYFAVMHQVNASLLILVCIKVIYIKKISNK